MTDTAIDTERVLRDTERPLRAAARDLLLAVRTNPHFSILQAPVARAALRRIGATA